VQFCHGSVFSKADDYYAFDTPLLLSISFFRYVRILQVACLRRLNTFGSILFASSTQSRVSMSFDATENL